MQTFDINTFIENKSLAEIHEIFMTAFFNAAESALELKDMADNRERLEAEEGGPIDAAVRVCEHFYGNAIEAMKVAFHRILGLTLFALDNDAASEERLLLISPEDRERCGIPFDGIHELVAEGNIWLTYGEQENRYSVDDDSLDAVTMAHIAAYLRGLL